MAATTSNVTPRRNGFDFAALSASSRTELTSGDEVARLRAAVETLSDLVLAHGIMDARTLRSLLGEELAGPAMVPVALAAPLPPPAPSAQQVLARPAPVAAKPAPVAAKPAPAPTPVAAKPAPAPAPVAAKPAPAPAVVAPAPAVVPAPVVAPAPAPIAAAPVAVAAPTAPTLMVPAPVVKAEPVKAEPVKAEPVAAQPAPAVEPAAPRRRSPFDTAAVEAELTEAAPQLKQPGFFGRLFGKKQSPAALAAQATDIEFTERVPRLPVDGLYSEQQRATELAFPPPETIRKPRRAAAPKKRTRPVDAAPARFCDRCWRRMDASGVCTTCASQA